MWTAFGIAIVFLGVVGIVAAIRRGRATAKDEFERRNAAGVLEYESFEESLRAKQRKMMTQWLANGAGMVIFIGIMMTFVVGPLLDKDARHQAEQNRLVAAEAAIDAEATPLAEACVAGDRSACRKWCALPGTTRACIKNWGHADGPR